MDRVKTVERGEEAGVESTSMAAEVGEGSEGSSPADSDSAASVSKRGGAGGGGAKVERAMRR